MFLDKKKKKSPLGISADGSIAHSFIFRDVLSYRLSSGSSQLSILAELKVPDHFHCFHKFLPKDKAKEFSIVLGLALYFVTSWILRR